MASSGKDEDVMVLLRNALQSRDRSELENAIRKAEKVNKATANYNLRLAKEMLELVNRELEMRSLLQHAIKGRVRIPLEDTIRSCEQGLDHGAQDCRECCHPRR